MWGGEIGASMCSVLGLLSFQDFWKEFLTFISLYGVSCRRDIMWKYYEKEKNYSAAARILAKLADRDRDADNFTLWDRIDYISRAILCAKACSTSLNNEVSSNGHPTVMRNIHSDSCTVLTFFKSGFFSNILFWTLVVYDLSLGKVKYKVN